MKFFRKLSRSVRKRIFPSLWIRLDARREARATRRHWDVRIADVLACPDNARLPRVAEAGAISEGWQVMHNGLKVVVDGYYGDGVTRMLAANRGCHEPQEEVIFAALLRMLPAGATMVEAGAYWGFYSMWLCQAVPGARVFLIEPAADNLAVGRRNFAKNGFTGDFTHAYIGAEPGRHPDGIPIASVQSLAADKGLEHLTVLHGDVQGFELEMLQGSRALLERRAIDFVFVSTHTPALHTRCAAFLEAVGYRLLASVNLEETHSYDGLLVACSPGVTPPDFGPPARKGMPAFRA